MDHLWASTQLLVFVLKIDQLAKLESDEPWREASAGSGVTQQTVADELISLDPVIRDVANAARPELGNYQGFGSWDPYKSDYWQQIVRHRVLQAIGIHTLGAEAREKLRPDSPGLVADQFHPWVWEAAAPMWEAGSAQEAVHAAARSVNARLQQKRGHHDKSDAALCREFFSPDPPARGRPRLRFPGYSLTDPTWRSRQVGAMDFGAGCFEGIRNPAAHKHGLKLPEQIALEQLASFSLLARWIEECTVEEAQAAQPEAGAGLDPKAPDQA